MMNFPFLKCPYIIGFTLDTVAEEWTVGSRMLTPQHNLLIYHESAEVLYSVGETVIRGTPGSVLLLPNRHSADITVNRSGSVICIGFEVQKDCATGNLSLIATAAPSLLRNRFLHFAALHATSPSVGSEFAMLSEFYGILYELQRNTSAGNRRSLLEEKIRPSVAYLENHLTDRLLKMDQVAALSGVSETYFRTLFSEQFGCTPLQYVIENRIRKAEKLLTGTDLPLNEIERACGFQSHGYFMKQFQRIVKKTPDQLRNQATQD